MRWLAWGLQHMWALTGVHAGQLTLYEVENDVDVDSHITMQPLTVETASGEVGEQLSAA